MPRWLVTDGDRQFSVRDIQELKQLAHKGEISSGTMIQPPGAADWLYATEVPELKGLVKRSRPISVSDDDLFATRPRSRARTLITILAVAAVLGGIAFYKFASSLPDMSELNLLGGPYGLELTEMLVTAPNAQVRSTPDKGTGSSFSVPKDSRLKLLAKRGDWYQVQVPNGPTGWILKDQVVPAYFFADARERENYDPIYNPDNYLFVKNSNWMQLPDGIDDNITLFYFLLQNKSKFEMTNIKLLATIKDQHGNVLEQKEFALEGYVPPHDGVLVGTLAPPEDGSGGSKRFLTSNYMAELAEYDEDLWLRWSEGVEVQMESRNYSEANIDVLQVQAVSPSKRKKK